MALAALFLGTFVLGTAELLVVGVIDLIAGDMAVSISTAGTLVTLYALGISIGGPLLTALSMRFGRRSVLLLSLALYVAGNVLAAIAADFAMLLFARALHRWLHGLVLHRRGICRGPALSRPKRMGRARSIVIAGTRRFYGAWRTGRHVDRPAIRLARRVRRGRCSRRHFPDRHHGAGAGDRSVGAGGFATQVRHALAPRVLALFGVGFLLIGGQYPALTYMTPFLQQVTGISGGWIGIFLFAYGAATAIGTFAGGWAADRNPGAALIGATSS